MATDVFQREFHEKADSPRYLNRLRNPLISLKEARIADRVLGYLCRERRNILEIGSGEGANLVHITSRGTELGLVVGVDFSFSKVSYQTHNSGFPGVCADAVALPFKDGVFDLVLCRDLLHHVNSARDKVIEEALRVVHGNGKVIVVESDGSKLLNRIFQLVEPVERGMKDSTPISIMALGFRHGQVISLEPIEASFLLRAVSYYVGYPQGIMRLPVSVLYRILSLWEKAVETVLPKSRWFYWEMVVTPFQHDGTSLTCRGDKAVNTALRHLGKE